MSAVIFPCKLVDLLNLQNVLWITSDLFYLHALPNQRFPVYTESDRKNMIVNLIHVLYVSETYLFLKESVRQAIWSIFSTYYLCLLYNMNKSV